MDSLAEFTMPQTEPLAIWSLCLGLVSVTCCGLLATIPAIICGHLALRRIRQEPHRQGRGLALAGLIIGYIISVLMLIYLVVVVTMAIIGAMGN